MFDLQGMTQKDWKIFCERGRRAQQAVDKIIEGHTDLGDFVIPALRRPYTPPEKPEEAPGKPQERDG